MSRKPIYEQRGRIRGHLLVLLGCLAFSTYFAVHAIGGKHGFEARSRLLKQTAKLERELAGLEVVRARLASDIAYLSDPAPDPDFISDLASNMLGFVGPQDMTIHKPKIIRR